MFTMVWELAFDSSVAHTYVTHGVVFYD